MYVNITIGKASGAQIAGFAASLHSLRGESFSFNDKNSQGHGIHLWTWVNKEPTGVKDVASGLRKCVGRCSIHGTCCLKEFYPTYWTMDHYFLMIDIIDRLMSLISLSVRCLER